MKMQNEVQAPRAGRVIEIRATPGQTVPAGFVLAILE
jgi:biotin carboxyl carrier protein